MSKKIEFVDLLIKEHKILKGDNQLFEDGYIEECIQTLEQIKCELEAWEELKPEIKEHKEVLYENELTNALVFALPYNANPKKYNAIKKALEVEDE